ncbi:MAG: hypothetical protein ABJC04_14155 [Verrucomicrobiota bacterium]
MQTEKHSGVLDKLLEPIARCLTPESARSLLEMRYDDSVQERVALLADKCNKGMLSRAEQREYEDYVHAGNIASILQAKARLFLKRNPAN